jgi:predicted alpha/beta-hydrolase family hydrolase
MATTSRDIRFIPGAGPGEVSAILDRPDECRALFVLGHGSGSNMRVPVIAGLSDALVDAGVATFRYQYPYSESVDFVPYTDMEMDDEEVLLATVRSAVATAAAEAPDLAVFAGGHSMGGLLTSMTDAASPLAGVTGLVILGFPLKGDFERAAHMSDASHPMLFLQGTDDTLGSVDEIKRMVGTIETDTSLHFVESADHGFSAPNRSDEDVHAELARTIADWTAALV